MKNSRQPRTSAAGRRGAAAPRRLSSRRWRILPFALLLATAFAVMAEQPLAPIPPADSDLDSAPSSAQASGNSHGSGERWLLLGSFRGSTSSRLVQGLNDTIFELEAQGDLYRDLGTLSVGVGADIERGEVDFGAEWDNSFRRRVEPLHEALEPGHWLTGDHISRFVDAQSVVSRGRIALGPLSGNQGFDLEMIAEGGVSLTLARIRRPLLFADRPFREILGERGLDEFQEIARGQAPLPERSLLNLTAEGIAALGNGLAAALGRAADTERGVIFYQDTVDSATLFFDVGIPIPVELFTSADKRLGVGDQIRLVTFLGYSPLTARIHRGGLESRFQHFTHRLREITVSKEANDRAKVEVRDYHARGRELVPLKLRPEIRLLSVIKIGHTFFEKRWDHTRSSLTAAVFEVDLKRPAEAEDLRSLLDDAAHIHSMDEDAVELSEPLWSENRQTKRQASGLRLNLFSAFRLRDQRLALEEIVERQQGTVRETLITRSRRLRRRVGKDQNWSRRFLVHMESDPAPAGRPATAPLEAMKLTFLNGLRDENAEAADIARSTRMLRTIFGSRPQLEAILKRLEERPTGFFVNVHLRFDQPHLSYFLAVSETQLWHHLADLLLGPGQAGAWSSRAARERFRSRHFRRQLGLELGQLPPAAFRESLSLRSRFRLARRIVRHFHRLQELLKAEGDPKSLARPFRRFRDIDLLQWLLYRLALDSGIEPSYDYEIFTDRMLKPFIASNLPQSERKQETSPVAWLSQHTTARDIQWPEHRRVQEASAPRLHAGSLTLEATVDRPGRLVLRLFSDLRFSPELKLRIDVRRSSATGADEHLFHQLQPLGGPHSMFETQLTGTRFYYDIPLSLPDLEERGSYTLLLRLLNPGGLAVSEEQQLRFEWPDGERLRKAETADAISELPPRAWGSS